MEKAKARGCVKSRKWYAPKGQKLLAQGSALGVMYPKAKRPVRAKALIMNAFALTGRIIYNIRLPRALPYPLYTSLTILNISHLQKKLSSPVLKVVYPGRDWLL